MIIMSLSGITGTFYRLKWRIWHFSPLKQEMKSENQTVVQYKQPIIIVRPSERSRRFVAALVKNK